MDKVGSWLVEALNWWRSLGYEIHFYAWIAAGLAGFVIWLLVSYNLIRKLIGHHKIKGAWIKPAELDEVLDRLQRREIDGAMLSLDDKMLLETYRPDRKLHLKRMGDSDFVSW